MSTIQSLLTHNLVCAANSNTANEKKLQADDVSLGECTPIPSMATPRCTHMYTTNDSCVFVLTAYEFAKKFVRLLPSAIHAALSKCTHV